MKLVQLVAYRYSWWQGHQVRCRGPVTVPVAQLAAAASWRSLRAQEFGGNAGMGAMGVIIPSVWTVPRVFLDGQSAASRCYLQTAKKG